MRGPHKDLNTEMCVWVSASGCVFQAVYHHVPAPKSSAFNQTWAEKKR